MIDLVIRKKKSTKWVEVFMQNNNEKTYYKYIFFLHILIIHGRSQSKSSDCQHYLRSFLESTSESLDEEKTVNVFTSAFEDFKHFLDLGSRGSF